MAPSAFPGPGWSEALRLATGYNVDLRQLCDGRAMICPAIIVVQKDPYAGASLTMTDNQGNTAIDRMITELNRIAELMPSLQAGKLGLMDIDLMHQASTVWSTRSARLTSLQTYAGQLVTATSSSADGSDGEFRRSLAHEIEKLEQRMSAQVESHQSGARPIESLINDAAQAISSFGMRMARAFHEANPNLIQVATSFWEGANANLAAYWQANGWGPGGTNSRLFETAPGTAETLFTAAISGYTSAGLPGLPTGTPPIVADLHNGWGAFGEALNQLLGQILDAMDEEANDAFAALRYAYRALIMALGGSVPEDDLPMFLHSVRPGDPDPSDLASPVPALQGIPASQPSQGIPVSEGTPALPGIPVSEGIPALPGIPVSQGIPVQPAYPLEDLVYMEDKSESDPIPAAQGVPAEPLLTPRQQGTPISTPLYPDHPVRVPDR